MSIPPGLWLLLLLSVAGCQRDTAQDSNPTTTDASATPQIPAPANHKPAGQRIEAAVRFLASDALAGRQVGTPGYEQAADYVARRYAQIGLLPAGDDGSFFQRVPLVQSIRERDGARLDIQRGGRSIALRFLDQFMHDVDPAQPQTSLEAPAVFVGQAIHAPALGHDDFAGLDLRGKIAGMLPDAPATFDNDLRAFPAIVERRQVPAAAGGADHPEPAAGRVEGEALPNGAGLDLVVAAQRGITEEAAWEHPALGWWRASMVGNPRPSRKISGAALTRLSPG